jgi:hypothetical protein
MAKPKADVKKPVIKTPKKKSNKIQDARLLLVWDRSGSMAPIQADAIGAFNTYVQQQKDIKGNTTLSFFMFDTEYETVYDAVDVNTVTELTAEVYYARGMTALLDAVGKTINTYKNTGNKDEKTTLVIMTDGQENASREFTAVQIKQLVTEVQEKNGWEVLFLGANIDSFGVGSSLGIASRTTTNFDFGSKGMSDAVKTMAYASAYTRGATSLSAEVLNDAGEVDLTKLYDTVKKDESKVVNK